MTEDYSVVSRLYADSWMDICWWYFIFILIYHLFDTYFFAQIRSYRAHTLAGTCI